MLEQQLFLLLGTLDSRGHRLRRIFWVFLLHLRQWLFGLQHQVFL